MRKVFSIAYVILFLSVLTAPAQAYLDPGSGSMFLQLLLGGFAGVVVIGKMYWQKLKLFLSFKKAQGGDKDNPSS